MTTKELYEQIGGNYDEALSRLSMDKFVSRFIIRFLDDPSCNDLIAAWEAHDEAATFKAAHTAKGVCANLAITRLCDITTSICEATREGNEELRTQTDIDALVAELKSAYADTVQKIEAFKASA